MLSYNFVKILELLTMWVVMGVGGHCRCRMVRPAAGAEQRLAGWPQKAVEGRTIAGQTLEIIHRRKRTCNNSPELGCDNMYKFLWNFHQAC
jgi:hypothetical protein